MASWWTITVPAGFEDVTAQAMKNPAFKAGLDKVSEQGGTTEAHFWSSDATVVLALDSRFGDMPNSLAVLDGFESGARKTSYGTGKEHGYSVDKDGVFVLGHQHATSSSGEEMWIERWTGRGKDGALHSLGVICTGPDTTCKPLLSTVKVDPKTFVLLSDIPAGDNDRESTTAYRIGYAVGVALVLAVFAAIYAKIRERKRALESPTAR